jgi:hypothetical protein
MTAPAIGGAAIALAVVLVSWFRPEPESSVIPDDAPAAAPPESVAERADRRAPVAEEPAAVADAARGSAVQSAANPVQTPEAAPLPGQVPATPMTQLFANRQEPPPALAEGERAFVAEPIDATWAPGAEADLLAKFAQMPGLKLIDLNVECRSTMCRLQLTQPSGGPEPDGGRPFNILLDEIGYEPRWMMAIAERSGPMRSIAYLWREGFAPERPVDERHETN